MKKKGIYTIFAFAIMFITLFVVSYSSQTYSEGVENANFELTDDDIGFTGHIGNEDIIGVEEYNLTTDATTNETSTYLDCENNNKRCVLKNVPKYQSQGSGSGLCWAFSSLNSLEASLLNHYNQTLGFTTSSTKFSQPHLGYASYKYFSNNVVNPYATRYCSNITDGGEYWDADAYFTNGIGPIQSTSFSLDNFINKTLYSQSSVLGATRNYRVTETRRLAWVGRNASSTAIQNKINDTKNYLRQGYGLVISDYSFSTKCSCYNSTYHSLYCPGVTNSGYGSNCGSHDSTIVGWDDTFNNFNVVSGDPTPEPGAWIIRNSHSYSGYYYISYYSGQAEYVVTGVERVGNYDNFYQLYPYKVYPEKNSKKVANIYQKNSATKNETLTEIAFNTSLEFFLDNASVSSVSINIYYTDKISDIVTGASNSSDIFNSANKLGTITVTTGGFYTYKLTTPKTIEGDKFIIGLSSDYAVFGKNENSYYNAVGGNDLFFYEDNVSYRVDPTTNLWINQYVNGFNYTPNAIKVYTKNTSTTSPSRTKVTNITISGPDGIVTGNDIQLTASISPSNAYNKLLAWTSSNTSVATVDANGKVTGISNGTITITAHATDGSGIKATKQIDVSPTGVIIPVESLEFTNKMVYLSVGQTYSQMPIITPSNATYQELTWVSSSTPSVYSINENGVVTALAAGIASVRVKEPHSNKYADYTIKVTDDATPVTGVTLNQTSLNLSVGETQTLIPTISPSNATNHNVTWSSSNNNVATVNTSGKVTAIGVGTTTIAVTTVDGNKKAYCSVTVTQANIPVTGITLNQTSLNLSVGSSYTLIPTISPSNATNQNVTYSSNNTSVATVDSNGKVTAVGGGSATITATTVDGSIKAYCTVTVNVPVTGITLNRTLVSLNKGDTYTLVATITPSNATNKNITWTTGNSNVATVDRNGKITAVGVGITTITVTTVDGGKTAKCVVRVVNNVNPSPTILPTSVSLDKDELELTPNSTYTLTATVLPSNATDKTVTFSSSNTNVATVDSNGKVTAKKVGTATITVKTNTGNLTDTCNVTVINSNVPVTGVQINSTSPLNINLGETVTLTASITPSNATNQNVTWNISDTSALTTVSTSGKSITIKAEKIAENVTITVNAADNHTHSIIANVVKPNIPVTGVILMPKTYTMFVGNSYTFTYNTKPINATNQEVTWSSSNTKVARIANNGRIVAVQPGTTVITVKTVDGEYTASSTLIIKKQLAMETDNSSISEITKPKTSAKEKDNTQLEILNSDVSIASGTYEILKYNSNIDSSEIVWTSSDDSVVKVISGMIVGLSEGRATIKGSIKGTTIAKEIQVDITKGENVVTLQKESKDIIEGTDLKLGLVTNLKDEEITSIEWITEDNKVIDVNGGVVTGLNEGDGTVLVKINDKYVTTMDVEVLINPENLHINVENYDLEFNQSQHEYELTIDKKDKTLNIITDKDDKVTITGNEKLKNGSVITVNYVDNHGQPQTYTINIIKEEENPILFYLAGVMGILLVTIVVLYLTKRKSK